MNRDEVIALLRAHQRELKSAGIESLRVFGSVARDAATDASDVDLVVRLRPEMQEGGFAYFGRLDALANRIGGILGCHVDLVAEPVRKVRLRREIEREATHAF